MRKLLFNVIFTITLCVYIIFLPRLLFFLKYLLCCFLPFRNITIMLGNLIKIINIMTIYYRISSLNSICFIWTKVNARKGNHKQKYNHNLHDDFPLKSVIFSYLSVFPYNICWFRCLFKACLFTEYFKVFKFSFIINYIVIIKGSCHSFFCFKGDIGSTWNLD